jgi:hypothetical protein
MKTVTKLFGFIALAAIVGFIMAACSNPAGGPTGGNAVKVTIAAIAGVTAPATGVTPVTTITETPQYTGIVTWNPNHATFAASTVYTATITLVAKAGYTLQGVTANFFTVAGATATNAANSGIINATFPATGAAPATVINTSAVAGVTVPATGATPVTTITETAQYSGNVIWNPNHSTFAASTVYTATITLTAKAGYTLQGVAANFFTVNGATATNLANSGVITATFPATGATPATVINTAAITGVTVPAIGATPVAAIAETPQYSGVVTWNPDHATFAEGTIYTATITLTAKAGYTLQGVAANFFTVAGTSTPATNVANSGVITATFPATPTPVTGVTLNTDTLALIVGDSETLIATVAPETATNPNVSWTSSAPGVASVNGGVVSALAAGTTTITVTTEDSGKTAECTITVQQSEIFIIDIIDAAPVITGPTISRTGTGYPQTAPLSVLNPELYSSIEWHISGTIITVSGSSITLDAGNTAYNRIGEHFLTLEVLKDGIPYNRTVIFTVVE